MSTPSVTSNADADAVSAGVVVAHTVMIVITVTFSVGGRGHPDLSSTCSRGRTRFCRLDGSSVPPSAASMMWSTALALTVHFGPRIRYCYRSRSSTLSRSLRHAADLVASVLAVGAAVAQG